MPKVVPFILARGGKDVILLNIRREVIILVRLASSRVMLLVLLTSSRLRLRRSRELPSTLLQLSHEPALMRTTRILVYCNKIYCHNYLSLQ
jgi:hypothetical protein